MMLETNHLGDQARDRSGVAVPRPAPLGLAGFTPRRDVRLVEVFLRATRTQGAAAAAREIGVRATVVHRWRATGGEPLDDEVRASILAFLVRWSMREECRDS
jgi:hypothetical protein